MPNLIALNRRFWPVATLVILAAITVLSLIPQPALPPVSVGGNLQHVVAYAALAFPVALAQPRYWLWLLALFLAWGGVIELVQPYVNRHGTWADVAANGLGIAVGVVSAEALRRIAGVPHERARASSRIASRR